MESTVNDQTSGKGIASLVCGILAFVGFPCCGALLSVAAICLGWGEKSGPGRAGWIMGWIHLALTVLFVMAALAFLFLAAVSKHHH